MVVPGIVAVVNRLGQGVHPVRIAAGQADR
jgi:hypothetical protein